MKKSIFLFIFRCFQCQQPAAAEMQIEAGVFLLSKISLETLVYLALSEYWFTYMCIYLKVSLECTGSSGRSGSTAPGRTARAPPEEEGRMTRPEGLSDRG